MWKKLATPFVKIWDWIKETAWIQPLLIVGIVFGIIFSISPLVSWIQGMQDNTGEAMEYYNRFNVSLRGVSADQADDTSEAGKLVQNIMTAYNSADATERNNAIENLPAERFFLAFVEEDCTACEEAKGGFEYLEKNFGSGNFVSKTNGTSDNLDFNLVTINVGEERNSGDTEDETLFSVFTGTYSFFFETFGGNMFDSEYYIGGHVDETSLETFISASSSDTFPTPSILLVDFTTPENGGVRDIMFQVQGKDNRSGDGAKALTLMDCWNKTGDFSLVEND